jgi:hypothetical protein
VDSDEFFKVSEDKPVKKVLTKDCNDESEAKLNINKDVNKSIRQTKMKNKVKTANQRTGIKRKADIYENNDGNFKQNEYNIETVLHKKKRVSFDHTNETKLNPATVRLKKSKLLNTNQFSALDNLPTSTPRECKIQMKVDMYNISPISFDKNNSENEKNSILLLSSNDNMSQQQITEFVKLQDKILNNTNDNVKNKSSEIITQEFYNHIKNEISVSNENTDENNLNISKPLSSNQLLNVITNKTIQKDNSSLEYIDNTQLNVEKQFINMSPEKNDEKKNTAVSYSDSPLLFNDTQKNENRFYKDKRVTFNIHNNSKNFTSELMKNPTQISKKTSVVCDFDRKSRNIGNTNFDSLQNDSEFSLHEWTNDYNSSYEYLSETEKKKTKFINFEDKIKLNSLSIKRDNSNVNNTLSDMITNDNNEITKIENVYPINNIHNSDKDKNIVLDSVEIDSIKNLISNKNKIIHNNVVNNQTHTLEGKENISENQESPILSFRNLKKIKINLNKQKKENCLKNNESSITEKLVSNEENKQNNVNNNSLYIENSNNSPIEKIDIENRFEGNIKNKSITKINNSNKSEYKHECEYIKITDNNKESDEEENKSSADIYDEIVNKKKISDVDNDNQIDKKAETDKIHKYNKNTDIKLNNKKLFVCITRIDENLNNKSPIISTTKKHNKLSAIKKRIKNPNKIVEIENEKNYLDKIQKKNATTITQNKKKISRFGSDYKERKEFSQLNQSKELVVLVTKLEDIDEKYKPLIMSKKTARQETENVFIKRKKVVKSNVKDLLKSTIDNTKNLSKNSIINKSKNINLKKNILNYEETIFSDKKSPISLKLSDLTRITTRKNILKTRNKPLTAITENYVNDEPFNIVHEQNEIDNKLMRLKRKVSFNDFSQNTLVEEHEFKKRISDDGKSLSVVLKPGKSWARSLSILNHFQNVENLDELAIGRGKNWRHSVQSILNMQPEGID